MKIRKFSVTLLTAVFLAIPIYFAFILAARAVGGYRDAYTLVEAIQIAQKQVNDVDSLHLLTVTSVDEKRPANYDGSDGVLPHWNVDLVAADNTLYHVEVRDGKVVSTQELGKGVYNQAVVDTAPLADSPGLAQSARENGLEPYMGRWGHGFNFMLTTENKGQLIVRGGSRDGVPGFLTFDLTGKNLLYGATRQFEGGGIQQISLSKSANTVEQFAAIPTNIQPNVSALAVIQLDNNPIILAGTDARRDGLVSEYAALYASSDDGATWNEVDGPFASAEAVLQITGIAGTNDIWVATTAGLMRGQQLFDGTFSWQWLDSGLPRKPVTRLVISEQYVNDQTALAAVGEPIDDTWWSTPGANGLYKTTNGGLTWQLLSTTPININSLSTNGTNTLLAVSDQMYVFLSSDGGERWQELNFQGQGVKQAVASPRFEENSTLFVIDVDGLWRSQDAGKRWELMTKDATFPANAPVELALSPGYPADKTLIYSAFRGGLFISRDDGQTWRWLDAAAFGGEMTPHDLVVTQDGRILFSVSPLGVWNPLKIQLDENGNPTDQ